MSDDPNVLMIEELVQVRRELSQLRASVAVLRIAASALLSPQDPAEGMKALELGEKTVSDAAGDEKEFRSYLDQVEVLKALGRGPVPNA